MGPEAPSTSRESYLFIWQPNVTTHARGRPEGGILGLGAGLDAGQGHDGPRILARIIHEASADGRCG